MMGESKMNSVISSTLTSASSSRLSPLARPFAIKTSITQGAIRDSASTLEFDRPFSSFGLGAYGYHAYHSDATVTAAFPCDDFEPGSSFECYQPEAYPLLTDFILSTDEPSETGCLLGLPLSDNVVHSNSVGESVTYGVQGMGADQQEKGCLCFKEEIAGDYSISRNDINLFEQDLFFSARGQCSQSQLSYPSPVSNWSHRSSNIIPRERCFSLRDSYGTKPAVSCAPGYCSPPAPVLQSSFASGIPSTLEAALVQNVGSGGRDAVCRKAFSSSCASGGILEANILQNSKESVASHDQVIIEKGKERHTRGQIFNEAIEGKSKLLNPREKCFSCLDSYGAEPASCAPGYSSPPSLVFKPSGASSIPSILEPVLIKNVDSGDKDVVCRKDNSSGCGLAGIFKDHVFLEYKEGVACHEQAIIEKSKERKTSEPVPNEALGRKTEPQVPEERCFSLLDSNGTEPAVSCAPEFSSPQASLIFKTSCANRIPSILEPALLDGVDSGDKDVARRKDHSCGCGLADILKDHVLQKTKETEAFQDQVIIEKSNERKTSEPFPSKVIVGKFEFQITCQNVIKDMILEQLGADPSVPIENSSVISDDADLDSPCWKGTRAYQSPFKVSETENSQVSKNEAARNSLNPLAPMFFPGIGKRKCDQSQDELHGHNSYSSEQTSAVGASSSEVINVHGKCSNNVPKSEVKYGMLNKLNKSSALDSSSIIQLYPRECHIHHVMGSDVEDFAEGINDAEQNGSSTSLSFLVKENVLHSPSTGFDVFSDFTERLPSPSKSTHSKLDIQLVLNRMHELSELLLQNCSNDFDSLGETEHVKIQNIIDNLYLYVKEKVGQRASVPEPLHSYTSFGPRESADLQKHQNIELQVSELKAGSVLPAQEKDSCKKLPDSRSRSNHEGLEKGNHVTQLIEKVPNEDHGMEGRMHPDALLYRNLWLEAELALCLVKNKASDLHPKPEPDRCKSK